ncbi:hypothetical protein [Clostridium vincentii]|uniref:Uncharacterized protein n=1 Tax=Clostridium vincentii TaxID=52704 RepID=A0A2T0B537_9CLOT|nr:hypothetical protein [Clostridium vincentii]PRR79000.1 hypothetical protein CLVI_34100 [Clostridium vincentii]
MKNRIATCFSLLLTLTMGLFIEALALLAYPIYPFAFLTLFFCTLSGICTFIAYKGTKENSI